MKKVILFLSICLLIGIAIPISMMAAQPKDGVYLGVFREGAPLNMGHIKSFQKTMGRKPAMVMWYLDWSSDFPVAECNTLAKYGAAPHIIWEPWIWGDEKKITLKTIVDGEWDQYIKNWAKSAAAFKKPVFIRWGHEFNIEKYPWAVGNNGKDPALYIKAYKHVHDIFTSVGATNVKWIWCFNNYNNPDEDWNAWDKAYPGDAYVDWVGIDGYNWGSTQSWSGWQSFKDCFREQVRICTKKYPTKPIMIAEFGSAEEGGNKAAWVKEIPSALKVSMKQVKAIMLFDVRKECDWRATSCKATENAYKLILKDPYFLSTPEGMSLLSLPDAKTLVSRVVVARKATKPVNIDGSFAPFAECAPIVMDNKTYFQEGIKYGGPKDLSAKIYFLWDESALYIFAKITDNIPMANSKTKADIWNGDALEVCVPGYQIGLGTGDGKANKPSIWIWQKNKASVEGKIVSRKTTSPTGYIVEAKIPWKELGFLDPVAKGSIPFDIAVDDADTTWTREKQLVWSGDYYFYKDPEVWGEMQFKN
jgi:hypothetical protein